MRGVRLGLLVAVAMTAGVLGAQEETPVPPRPERGLHDEARLLTGEPELAEAVSRRLLEFRERTGFRVEVALVSTLIGRTVFEESQRLRDAWLGDDPGLVLVLEADSGEWEIGWSERLIRAGDLELPAIGPSEVGPQERVSITSRLRALPPAPVRSVEGARRLVDELLAGLDEAVGAPEVSRGHPVRLLMLALGLGAAMLLVAMLVAAGVKRADRRAEDRLYFPKIEVGRRLQAPRGGGKVSSRSFGASA